MPPAARAVIPRSARSLKIQLRRIASKCASPVGSQRGPARQPAAYSRSRSPGARARVGIGKSIAQDGAHDAQNAA